MESIETHWSWVFLTPTRVFKLKKPIERPWVNLTELAARAANCHDELRLNQRLADGIYKRVLPLRQASTGEMALGGEGTTIDWILEMRRLPAALMLDTLLRRGEVGTEQVDRIGKRLAEFYAAQRSVVADGGLYLDHLNVEIAECRRVLGAAENRVTSSQDAILDQIDSLLRDVTPFISERIADGRIVEGHGDLRPEHVCLVDPVAIFDCLEFDRGMRILDPYDEMNYLGLECAFLGARWMCTRLLAVLDETIGGRPSETLLRFYGAFRAVLRARICLAHLDDEFPMQPERWPGEARAYLRMAEEELNRI